MLFHAKMITRAPPQVGLAEVTHYAEGTDVEICAAVLEALLRSHVGIANGGCVEVIVQRKRIEVAGIPGRS